jgi:uncharacterized protein (TIGR02466 family)
MPGADASFDEHYQRAVGLAAQQRFEDAAEAFQRALAVCPRDLGARLNLGLVLQTLGRFDEAVACYQAAAAIAPEFAETQTRLGGVLSQKGDNSAAVAAFRRSIALDPFSARSHVRLAHALWTLVDLAGAEAGFRRALELEPEQVEARAHLSMLLPQVGKTREAEVLLDYPLLLSTRRLDGTPRWPSITAFNDELAQCIFRHPTLERDPAVAATKGGSQTLEIFDGDEPAFAELKRFIDDSVTAYLDGVAPRATHIYSEPQPASRSLNAWAVVLRSGGHQRPHFHPAALVSGVYYVRVPEVVKAGAAGEAGFLVFGPPSDGASASTLSCPIRPQEGMVVVFPSYFWHRTVPFESDEARISIAFDVVRPAAARTHAS